MKYVSAVFLATTIFSAPASALPPLEEDPTVVNGFYAMGLADEIRKNCPDISARMFTAYMFLNSMKDYALEAGYSEDEIRALVENREEKKILRKKIRTDLRERGASAKTPEGYCTVGREEIAKDSMAGRLLREN